jgi:hypothetical protein
MDEQRVKLQMLDTAGEGRFITISNATHRAAARAFLRLKTRTE